MTAAPAGWSRARWRWEYRDAPGGQVRYHVHILRVAEVDWPDLQAELAARGAPQLPTEAEPSPEERAALIAGYAP